MDFKILDLGLIDYQNAWGLQKEAFQQVKNGRLNAALLICSHYPVITSGRTASCAGPGSLPQNKNILASRQELNNKGIGVYETQRGGDVTYHGPGQLTAYPVFNLGFLRKDIRWFLMKLESIIIRCLSDFGIDAHSRPGLTGVWVGKLKIASVGIAIKNWVTFHGLSINIMKNDLDNFNLIRPCGMDITMAALETFGAGQISMQSVKLSLIGKFRDFLTAEQNVFKEAEELLCLK
jgi:lipoyl(octanoyl) transferase